MSRRLKLPGLAEGLIPREDGVKIRPSKSPRKAESAACGRCSSATSGGTRSRARAPSGHFRPLRSDRDAPLPCVGSSRLAVHSRVCRRLSPGVGVRISPEGVAVRAGRSDMVGPRRATLVACVAIHVPDQFPRLIPRARARQLLPVRLIVRHENCGLPFARDASLSKLSPATLTRVDQWAHLASVQDRPREAQSLTPAVAEPKLVVPVPIPFPYRGLRSGRSSAGSATQVAPFVSSGGRILEENPE